MSRVKLLIEHEGMQKVITIHVSGSTESTVLWDERVDGPLQIDESKVGGYERSGRNLVINQTKLDASNAAKQAKDTEEQNKKTAKAALRTKLRSRTLTLKEVQDLLILELQNEL